MSFWNKSNSLNMSTQPKTNIFQNNSSSLGQSNPASNMFNMNNQRNTSMGYGQNQMGGGNQFANRYQMGMGNVSDSELKSVIDTYNRLYNPNNSENLVKWPVFNPRNIGAPKISFNGQVNNAQELEYLWTVSEQKLNPDPSKVTTCLLIGLEKLDERSKQNKQICVEMINQLDNTISTKTGEICHNVENKMRGKLIKIKEKNCLILNKIIKMEQKLFLIYKKLKKETIQLDKKMRLTQILKDAQHQVLLLEQQVQEIKYMIDGKFIILRDA